MGADSNGSQAKGGASGKGGTQADSNGARKKTSAPSVHDARKVSCPLILLGSVSARAPDLLHLNQASSRSGRSAIARRPEHELLPSSSDELSVGAAHSRSCASGNTLAPAGITHGLYFQGCADREWPPPIKIKIGNVTSSQRASARCELAPLDNFPPRKHSTMTFLSRFYRTQLYLDVLCG